ncbi:MAG: hypothetical protein IPP79_17755 [Chitinophagaceae bacterium]|nr:hypothetical protein [Chitinophagaceae bacterium]
MFDITLAPIISAYGFGFTKKGKVTASLIVVFSFIGYKKVNLVDKKFERIPKRDAGF